MALDRNNELSSVCSFIFQQGRPSLFSRWLSSERERAREREREKKNTRLLGSELAHRHFYHILLVKANHKASPYSKGCENRLHFLIRGTLKIHWRDVYTGRGEELRKNLQSVSHTHKSNRKSKPNIRKNLKVKQLAMVNGISNPSLSYYVMTYDF